jgi:hypothetical protein
MCYNSFEVDFKLRKIKKDMTRSSKHQNFIKCSLDSGKKGTLVIRKTNRSFRRHRAANIAAANAAKKKEVEEIIDDISDLTPQTA